MNTSPLVLGMDFDNTMVCYDRLFHTIAMEEGLIPEDFPAEKTAIRNHLRASGQEPRWTQMQGQVYGGRIMEADPFPGLLDFLKTAVREGISLHVISHRTLRPITGGDLDMHHAARCWLEHYGISLYVPSSHVHYETDREKKIQRIRQSLCTHFIDDLPEFLSEPGFPEKVVRILFDPQLKPSPEPFLRIGSWDKLASLLIPRFV